MEFIDCGDILETDMTIDDVKYEDEKVKVEEDSDPIKLSDVETERSSRKTRRVISLRNTRKQKQSKPEPSKIFWCFGVPRHLGCELCFGSCLPLRCCKCKVVQSKANLIKSYDCAMCGKSCNNISEFKEHMKADHVNLKCKDCGKCFPNKVRLKAHTSIHKERKYLCELCSSAFQRLDQYKSHYKRKHTNSKDFICTECGKAWKTKGDLTQHMRVHDDRYRPVKQIMNE